MSYKHTQKGPWYLLFLTIAAVLITAAIWEGVPLFLSAIVGGVAGIFVILSLAFRQMTVSDQGDELSIQYGPLPLFQKRIAYADITRVEAARTSLIDGWGIHWIPMRGWTYNIWGFECAKISLGKRVIRIGSDDVENFVQFLKGRVEDQTHPSPASQI